MILKSESVAYVNIETIKIKFEAFYFGVVVEKYDAAVLYRLIKPI